MNDKKKKQIFNLTKTKQEREHSKNEFLVEIPTDN